MINLDKEINNLINSVEEKYRENGAIEKEYANKIIRGHKCPISGIVENEVTKFLCNILDDKYKYYIDFTINKRRPDLLIVNSDTNQCELIVEIKANMGFCRDIEYSFLNGLVNERKMFKNNTIIKQKDEAKKDILIPVSGNPNVKMVFISFTEDNASVDKHNNIKKNLNKENIGYYKLFYKWYNELVELEIRNFVDDLKNKYGLKFK